MDTIFAPATAPGKAGVAIIRISGSDAFAASRNLVGKLPPLRTAVLRSIRSGDGALLDRGLVLCFGSGSSFTGEDSVEMQVHGSQAVVSAILDELGKQPGLRPAHAGEFTRRALENEQLDLVQVEGLSDLIEAETELQRRQALTVFDGKMSELIEDWRSKLVHALALLEATIDFVDEDVPVDVFPEVKELVQDVSETFKREADGAAIGERLRDGFDVAIVGKPNSGKSTLLNALAGRDVAITSDIPGTTRDIIEARLDLNGIPVTFLDTAGIRETDDTVEKMGVERAVTRAKDADLRVFLKVADGENFGLDIEEEDLVLWAKGDLADIDQPSVSGITGLGIAGMLAEINSVLSGRIASIGSANRQRHAVAFRRGRDHLEKALKELASGEDRAEFAAEEIHRALSAMDELLGKVGVELVLDKIFSSFCIGK